MSKKNRGEKSNIKIKLGLTWIFILILSYFIKINVESGSNYNVEDRILYIIIFHNPYVLGIYLLLAIILLFYDSVMGK